MASSRLRLLVVDDDPQVLRLIRRFGENAGFGVQSCDGGREALDRVAHERVDVAVIDLRMPDVGGIEVLRAIRGSNPDCQTILMSGAATIDSAVEAVKLGAVDYLTKPFDVGRLKALLASVKDEAARRRQLLAAEREVAKNLEFCGMIGRSPVMQELFGLIRRLAPHVRTALVTGETGVGKELVARALHQVGPRRAKRFVALNCSAIPDTLFESELFGHVRGAFTGATDSKAGLFEFADGGTIFLDEVGDLPLAAQAKLLRVLETGEVQRLGTVTMRQVDVHVVAATNRDLRADVEAGRFREDLFYRLDVVEIKVAPLRQRREDIPYLTAAFVREIGARIGKRLIGTTPPAERWLIERPWDGNVRELRNVIERACILAEGEFITERELAGSAMARTPTPAAAGAGLSTSDQDADDRSLSALERERIRQVLESTGGNKLTAARILGLSRRALYRRIERYGLEAEATSKRDRSHSA
ncbi:MAG: sigma-54-dependent Fis family transcriptional regulator [Acidobacteria bacterium]|nr:sigma-54-dependent Fis family transcriptional regulator [Acidobacteriota bacterium]